MDTNKQKLAYELREATFAVCLGDTVDGFEDLCRRAVQELGSERVGRIQRAAAQDATEMDI